MNLDEIQKTVGKLVQGKTIDSVEVLAEGCKLIFEDLSWTYFYVDYVRGLEGIPVLGMSWGKERNADSSSN